MGNLLECECCLSRDKSPAPPRKCPSYPKEKQFQKEDHSEVKNGAAKHRQGFSQGSDCRGGSSTVSHKVPERVLHHEAVLILHEAIAEAMEPPRQKYGEDGGLRRCVQTPAALQAIWVQVKL